MPSPQATGPAPLSDEERITGIISRFDPAYRKLIQAARKAVQKRFPTANELVYDYARNFVIGYSPTHTGAEGIAALSAEPEELRFYLTNGAQLPDPHKLLHGKAGARYIVVGSAKDLLRPEVEALMAAAEKIAKVPLRTSGSGEVIIKPGASEKKPRKKPAKG